VKYQNQIKNLEYLLELYSKKLSLIQEEQKQKYLEKIDSHINKSCYYYIIQKLFEIYDFNDEFNFEYLHNIIITNEIKQPFDDEFNLNILVIQEILKKNEYHLKYWRHEDYSFNGLEYTAFLDELLGKEHGEFLIFYENHYILVLKLFDRFYMQMPEFKHSVSHRIEEFLDFIMLKETLLFEIEKGIDDNQDFKENLG